MSKALWAHQISRHGATKVISFEVVYEQEAMLPVEVNLDPYRLAKQNDLSAAMYQGLLFDNIYGVMSKRLIALNDIEKDKARVVIAYNRKVKGKSFQVRDLIWNRYCQLCQTKGSSSGLQVGRVCTR